MVYCSASYKTSQKSKCSQTLFSVVFAMLPSLLWKEIKCYFGAACVDIAGSGVGRHCSLVANTVFFLSLNHFFRVTSRVHTGSFPWHFSFINVTTTRGKQIPEFYIKRPKLKFYLQVQQYKHSSCSCDLFPTQMMNVFKFTTISTIKTPWQRSILSQRGQERLSD